MEALLQDLRYTLRGMARSPGFALVAVVTLALGIGVNSSIFSLVNAILLRPLPVHAPEELIDIYGHSATSSGHGSNSYLNYLDYKDQAQSLSGLMGYSNFFANLSVEGSSELVVGEIVTEDYFAVLGVQPALGRSFVAQEYEAEGALPVAILGHGFWQTRFGGAPDILDLTLRMNGIVYAIVGVAPEGFGGMFPAMSAQMWVPSAMAEDVEILGDNRTSGPSPGDTRLERRGRHWLWLKGRLAPGAEVAQARSELEGIAARLSEQYPESNGLERVTVIPTNDVSINPDFDGTLAPAGALLLGAVGLVLLVACANLANMLLARASTRRRELAVRIAIGASSRRMIRQLMTESMVLALAGGVAAVAIAYGVSDLIARLQPPLPIDISLDFAPDWRVLVFTLVAAVGTGLVFGLVPAFQASRPDLVPALKDSGDGDGARRGRWELRDLLVISQVAVSLTLLVGGALLTRSLGAAHEVEFGYDVDRTAYLTLAMEMNGYDGEQAAALLESGRLGLERLPEVEAVGLASRVPLSLNNNGFGVFIDGHQSAGDERPYRMDGTYVDEGYFSALSLEILEGRAIEATDRDESLRVAVVTQTMAERYWPGERAIGREFRTSWQGEPHRIVGVVEDYKVDTPGEGPKAYIHLPLARRTVFAGFLIRTTGAAGELVPTLERELRGLDPDLVFLETGTMRGLADVRLFPIRAGAWLIGVFGVLALVLASVGLYGVMAYSVSRRMRELGVRRALGADSGRIVVLVVRQGLLLLAVGGLVGAGLAAGAGNLLSSVLFVGSFDVISFGVAFLVLAAVSLVATVLPAWRASRADPMTVLRSG